MPLRARAYFPFFRRRRNRLYDSHAFQVFYQKQVSQHEDDEDIILRESAAGIDAASVLALEEDEYDAVSPLMLDNSPNYQREAGEVELGEDGDRVKAKKMLKMISAVPRRRQIRRIWDWIRTVVKYDENKVFLTYGIDMTLYLQFLRQLIVIFAILAVLGLCVLVPVNVSGTCSLVTSCQC